MPLLCALVLVADLAMAGAYKCVIQGKATYQDRPCASGGAVDLGPNSRPPLDSDRDAAMQRRESDIAAVAASRQAAEKAEAQERERQRAEAARIARAEEEARRRLEACQAEAARLKALAVRASGSWKARDDYAKRQRKHREKCGSA